DTCCIKAAETAVLIGDFEIVKFLVPHIIDQSNRDICCIKAAENSAEYGHFEIVKFLVPHIIDQSNRDTCCIRAAENAAISGHFEVVKFLVPQINDQSNRDTCCIKAAESAAIRGHFEVVKFLVPQINDQSNRDTCCIKAAESAAIRGHFEVVKFLVPQINDQSNRDTCCIKAAESAAINGHFKIVKFLVPQINDQSNRDTCCIKAAISAAINGHFKIVKFLVPQINDQSNRDTCCIKAAISAAINGHFKIVKFLVPQINEQSNRDTCIKAAEKAAICGHSEIVKFLISRLSSPGLEANLRFQCAVAACTRLHENAVASVGLEPQWLLQYSTILSFTAAMAIEGRNSLMQVITNSFTNSSISAPHLHAQDTHGRTALSRACQAGHVRAAKTLIDNGADASHRDNQGLTCAQLAQRFEQRQVLRLLNATENPQHLQAAAQRLHSLSDHSEQDRRLSEELHRLLSDAGFTEQRAKCQQRLADWLQVVASVLTQDGDRRQMTGSYAEGWANSLVQVNGRTAADSDIDWTVLVDGQQFHL
uniref:ANK_REP_REGION domain-containing protein n=1 Tax=Macrostomum lignano TaxID=282301 RepID=A0A1I8HGG6_9PLAT